MGASCRSSLLDEFVTRRNLCYLQIPHATYHHFMGEGAQDSNIDIVLHPKDQSFFSESLEKICCVADDPSLQSHHDVIISRSVFVISPSRNDPEVPSAPKVANTTTKTVWDEGGVKRYEDIIAPQLKRIRSNWLENYAETCVSLLLSSTNNRK